MWGCGALLLLLLLLRFLLRCSSPLPMAWGIPLRRLWRSRRNKLLGTNGRIGRLATGATRRVALAVMDSRRVMKGQAMGATSRAVAMVRVMGVTRRVAETAARVQAVRATRKTGATSRAMATSKPTLPTPHRHRRLLLWSCQPIRQQIPRPTRLRRSSKHRRLHSTSRTL